MTIGTGCKMHMVALAFPGERTDSRSISNAPSHRTADSSARSGIGHRRKLCSVPSGFEEPERSGRMPQLIPPTNHEKRFCEIVKLFSFSYKPCGRPESIGS